MTMHPLLQRQHYLLVLAIERCAIPLPMKKVLLEVLSACAETARQQQAEHTTMISLGCQVDLEQWAERLALEPPTLLQTLHILLEEGYFHHDPDEPFADGAWLTWNLAFDTWPCFAPQPKRPRARQAHPEEAADLDEDATDQSPWSPEALLAKRWKGRPPRSVWWVLRQAVLERDDYTCVYCGRRGGRLALDHLLPVSRGGTSELSNLVTACVACNSAKGASTPQEWLVSLQRKVGGY